MLKAVNHIHSAMTSEGYQSQYAANHALQEEKFEAHPDYHRCMGCTCLFRAWKYLCLAIVQQ